MSVVCYPVKDIWPHVLPHITRIHQRHLHHLDWKPDDIFHACWNRTAALFSDSESDAFAVIKTKIRNGKKIMFVWVAYGRRANTAMMLEIARNIEASSIEFGSPRRGFDRRAEWKRGITIYSMEVP